MHPEAIDTAARLLWRHWTESTRLLALPPGCRPSDRQEGYAIQRRVAHLSGQTVVGWKIAATSVAGQRHIGVDGPLVGGLLADRVAGSGAMVSLDGNAMRVAEAEFAFRFGRALPRRERLYRVEEVIDAVDSLHPAIEVPDSRYDDFARVGAPQLIADHACAWWLFVGAAARSVWWSQDLSAHVVEARLNRRWVADGLGANVLGDPRTALTWLVNERRVYGDGVRAGDLVTTGTCLTPVAIAPGDEFSADFGELGVVTVRLG